MSRWIAEWNPDDEAFWEKTGRRVARRNLIWSILAENLGFSVWLVWSVTAARLQKAGFPYSTSQLFTLVAIPGLVGALMRLPYTLAVPRFGGRNWTVVSALLLFIPATALAVLVGHPETPFWLMCTAAASAGFGGGNFASSMANISFFYPEREKGWALGLNAAGGNIGVSNVQLLIPIVVGSGAAMHLSRAGLMWMPFILVSAIGAWAFMDNLTSARSRVAQQLAVTKNKHTWVMSFLYIGTFGSFVGYSAAMPLLLKTQFPEWPVNIAFVGALVGSVARPIGGKLSDKLGGARVTYWNFIVMAAATGGVAYGLRVHSLAAFLGSFFLLFVTTGIGNGSTFRMIPSIFRAEALRDAGSDPTSQAQAIARGKRESAAVIGISAAIGALGGYFIPQTFSASIKATGGAQSALTAFLAFYAVCLVATWWFYTRKTFLVAQAPSLAEAEV